MPDVSNAAGAASMLIASTFFLALAHTLEVATSRLQCRIGLRSLRFVRKVDNLAHELTRLWLGDRNDGRDGRGYGARVEACADDRQRPRVRLGRVALTAVVCGGERAKSHRWHTSTRFGDVYDLDNHVTVRVSALRAVPVDSR